MTIVDADMTNAGVVVADRTEFWVHVNDPGKTAGAKTTYLQLLPKVCRTAFSNSQSELIRGGLIVKG